MRRTDSAKRRFFSSQIENLDSRTLLSASLVRGSLNINGTRDNDTIEIRRSAPNGNLIQVVENGRVVLQRNARLIKQVRVNTLAGDDTVKVVETNGKISAPVIFIGGDGNDKFYGGSGKNVIDGGRGTNIVHQKNKPAQIRNAYLADDVIKFGSTSAFKNFLTNAGKSRTGIGAVLRRNAGTSLGAPVALPSSPASPGTSSSQTSSDYSQTNSQVAGVDEADIIENDGKNLYIISRGELLIVDASNPDTPVVASRTQVDGYAQSEYLYQGRLTVISSVWSPLNGTDGKLMPLLRMRGGSQVQVTVFDVSDVTSPKILSKTNIDGWLSDSRMVNGKLAVIVQNDLLAGYWGGYGDIGILKPVVGSVQAKTSDTSLAKMIQTASIDRLLPSWKTQSFDGSSSTAVRVATGLISQPAEIYCPVINQEPNLSSVILFDTTSSSPSIVGTTSIVGAYASTIYMNSSDLYVFSPQWDETTGNRTGVQRFDISGQTPTLISRGSFDGYLLNQFSADAKGNYLRVATTQWTNKGTTNALYVLNTVGDTIQQVGAVENIANGESITSVRFVDDTAYLVTFRQVDPLFTIDLSVPTAPKVVGELKIPGFSRFLQPLGNGYLLGIGRDADPATGRTRGLKVSLFDVRDQSKLTELANYLISQPADSWTWSEAEWDHHALGYFPELGVIALPVQGYVQVDPTVDSEGNWIAPEYQSELILLKIDTDGGKISNLGAVDHNSDLLRSSRIGDVVFSVADLNLKAVQILTDSILARGSVELQKPYDYSGIGLSVEVSTGGSGGEVTG